MSRSLLVTGGAGFIGSTFVRQALARGDRVIVLDALTYAGHPENLENLGAGAGKYQFVHGEIADGKKVSEILTAYQIDAVVNFAAESHVDRSIASPTAFVQTNVLGVAVLLGCALEYWRGLTEPTRKSAFRFVQISTDEVYGSLGETGYFTEDTAYAPNSPYSASKAGADHLVRAWFHTFGLPTITTNCSNNYGPRQYPEKLIPHMIQCALTDRPLPVYGDGKNVRDWIHVEDHSRGIRLALDQGTPGETYCFGGRAERNNLDVVNTICSELDQRNPRRDGRSHKTSIQFVEDRLGHDRRYAIDDTKAETKLGFRREFAFDSGLGNTIEWYLAHEEWRQAVLKSGAKRG